MNITRFNKRGEKGQLINMSGDLEKPDNSSQKL